MILVDNITVFEEISTLISKIKIELLELGSNKLTTIRDLPDNIQVSCPVHKEGFEKRPSCGINKKTGTFNCFTCGAKGSLAEFISHCFGENDYGNFGKRWILRNCQCGESKTRELTFNPWRGKTRTSTVNEDELDSYRYIHPYMFQRGLTEEIIEKFDVGYDKQTQCITFPVWDSNGNCVFIARRRVYGKYFHYPRQAKKPLYGYNFLTKNDKTVVVVESILNALTCWKHGIPAIALIGLGNSIQYTQLQNSDIRKFIIVFDPDEAGREASKRLQSNIRGKLIEIVNLSGNKDLNELTDEEFLELPFLKQFS